jgi:transposase
MEACGGSHFMARKLEELGHSPKLISPQFVRPFVKSNKNDFVDAEAICEAASRPSMRFAAQNGISAGNAGSASCP